MRVGRRVSSNTNFPRTLGSRCWRRLRFRLRFPRKSGCRQRCAGSESTSPRSPTRLATRETRSRVSRFESASRLAARSSLPKVGVVLAFDYGTKRVGAACGDLGLRLAHPLETIKGAHRDRLFDRIAELIAEWKPTLLVVGFPTSLAGEEYELSREVRRFARELEARFHLPAEL